MSLGPIGFLADHDLNDRIVDGVLRRDSSIPFFRARELGLAGRPDDEVLDEAGRSSLVVVSHDVNTMTAAALGRVSSGRGHSGLILVAQRLALRIVIDELVLIWSATDVAEWRDRIEFLPL
ncbi:hypothetical protein ElP_38990 [Tautonia plasticadhaerens]|uniref:Uncharacterized protein n=1 Tax=Tautonia plasticadhaerens TaxID=2527974 RepID=A0A518H573_9BACT|nr:hypothetical protein ElP_38990 [Tautonia plasticadhaerens]